MRFVLGTSLIVSGVLVAAIGLVDRPTNGAPVAPDPLGSRRSPAGEQQRPLVSAVVTLPARDHASQPQLHLGSAVTASSGAALVRELQQELVRVGCYDGPLNGAWNAQTRTAMAAFVARANARLPTDKADVVLLALVKQHEGVACRSCPAGQETSHDGRCLPGAIAVRTASLQPVMTAPVAEEKPRTADVDVPRPSRRTARRAPLEGRMGVGGPVAAAKPSNRASTIAAAEPAASEPPPVIHQAHRDRRTARRANRRVAGRYLRPMRSARYAYRPFGRPRGIAALLFGWF